VCFDSRGGTCFGCGEKEEERKSRIEGRGRCSQRRQEAARHAREDAHQAQLVIELLDTVPMGFFGLFLRAFGVQFLHLWKFLIKLSLSLSLSLSRSLSLSLSLSLPREYATGT